MYLTIKVLLTAVLVVGISELGKRSPLMAGLLASLPLTSLLALTWLQVDTNDAESVIRLSWSILLILPPSFMFLAALPIGMRLGLAFWLALPLAMALTGMTYWLYLRLLAQVGIEI